MKRSILLSITVLISYYTLAQNATSGQVLITGSRFTYPLVEKWISEYKKEHPEFNSRILARGTNNTDSAHLVINAHKLSAEEIKPGYYTVNIGRYALLPFTNSKNPKLSDWQKKGIKVKDLKDLYFKKYDPFAPAETAKEKKKDKETNNVAVYTRAQKACAPITFASSYGFLQNDIVGKPIGGDDKHLITAVERDSNGVSYNNLNLIYDAATRRIKPNLAVIPIDLNGNGKLDQDENIYENLDGIISQLETKKSTEIPVEYINVLYSTQTIENNIALSQFLDWVFTTGQKFNHELGFLNFEPETLVKQREIFTASLNKQ